MIKSPKIVRFKTAGFVHTTLLFCVIFLGILLVIASSYLYKGYYTDLSRKFDFKKSSVAGVSIPSTQIVAIPKSECDIFVATSGNDNNTGTSETTSLSSIELATSRAQPGQAICIKGGEYRQVVESLNKHGNSQNPIKIGGYVGGGLPIISGGILDGDEYMLPNPQCKVLDVCSGNLLDSGKCRNRNKCIRDFLFNILDSSHIHVYGIDVRGSSGRGFGVSDSNNVYVRGMRTYHNWSQGFQFSGETATEGNNLYAEYIAVYDNIRAMAEKNLIGGGAVHVNGVKGGYIRNSLVFENFGEGLDVHKGTTEFIVTKNMLWDNFHAFLYANGATDATLNANLLFCTKNRVKWLEQNGIKPGNNTGYGSALTLRNEEIVTSQHGEGGGTIASNNLILGCTGSIQIAAQGDANLEDVAVLNNTIVSPRDFPPGPRPEGGIYEGKVGEGISISGKAGSLRNIHVENNVILADSTGDSILGGAMGSDQITYINNIVSKPPQVSRSGIIVADPKLEGNVGEDEVLIPANINPAHYMISNVSPAIGMGSKPANSRNLLDKDFFGNYRGNNPIDLGAYEQGNASSWPNLYQIIMSGSSLTNEDNPPTSNEGNALRNASFEELATPNSQEVAKYWIHETLSEGQVRYSSPTVASNEFSSGRNLLVEFLKPASTPALVWQNDVILLPSSTYTLSFSGKSQGLGSRVMVDFYEMGSNNRKVAPRKLVVLRQEWRRYNLKFKTRAFDPSKRVRVVIQTNALLNNKVELDNFELR